MQKTDERNFAKPKKRERKWPHICRMCGVAFKSSLSKGAKFCSGPCGSMYWRRIKQYEAWNASLTTKSEKELLAEYENSLH